MDKFLTAHLKTIRHKIQQDDAEWFKEWMESKGKKNPLLIIDNDSQQLPVITYIVKKGAEKCFQQFIHRDNGQLWKDFFNGRSALNQVKTSAVFWAFSHAKYVLANQLIERLLKDFFQKTTYSFDKSKTYDDQEYNTLHLMMFMVVQSKLPFNTISNFFKTINDHSNLRIPENFAYTLIQLIAGRFKFTSTDYYRYYFDAKNQSTLNHISIHQMEKFMSQLGSIMVPQKTAAELAKHVCDNVGLHEIENTSMFSWVTKKHDYLFSKKDSADCSYLDQFYYYFEYRLDLRTPKKQAKNIILRFDTFHKISNQSLFDFLVKHNEIIYSEKGALFEEAGHHCFRNSLLYQRICRLKQINELPSLDLVGDYLLQKNDPILITDENGNTALHQLVQQPGIKPAIPSLITWFEKHGISLNMTNHDGESIMDMLSKQFPDIKSDIEKQMLSRHISSNKKEHKTRI